MLRISKIALPFAGDHPPRRRRHQFTPSVGESASRLEDRTLLSAAGGPAHAAMAAHNLAGTPAGRHVTAMFQSILHTDPTQHQVTQWVHRIRAGTSMNVLRRRLIADARSQTAAADPPVTMVPSTSASPTGVGTSAGDRPAGLASSIVGLSSRRLARNSIRQVPGGASLSVTSAGVESRSITVIAPTPTRITRTTRTPTATTTASTTTPTSTTTTSMMSTSSLGIGSIPTLGQTTTTGTPATIVPFSFSPTPLQFAPVTFAPTTTIRTPANPSPLPFTGTLQFTGTPSNPSPLPSTGTLPFTGIPANPSPLPSAGTLPFTGTPANPSPLPSTGTLPFTGTPANPSPVPMNGLVL